MRQIVESEALVNNELLILIDITRQERIPSFMCLQHLPRMGDFRGTSMDDFYEKDSDINSVFTAARVYRSWHTSEPLNGVLGEETYCVEEALYVLATR